MVMGLSRSRIAKENNIGDGTVTAITKEAREQDCEIDVLRCIAIAIKQEGLEVGEFGFAYRIKKIMEQNEVTEEQLEILLQDFATCCFKQKEPVGKLIQCGYEALCLSDKFGISVEKIPETIEQQKKVIDRQEERLKELMLELPAMEIKHANIVAGIEKYESEYHLIDQIEKLENTVDYFERQNTSLRKLLKNARHDFMVMDEKYTEAAGMLTRCTCNLLNHDNESNVEEEVEDEK